MKSTTFLSFLITIVLSSVLHAQGDLSLKLDASGGRAAEVAGITRSRTTAGDTNYRLPLSAAASDIERRVFNLINKVRRDNGLSEVVWSDDVAAVARLHSANMASAQFFSHQGTDGSMVDDRADRLNLGEWRMIGENIAYMRGYDDPASLAVEKWIASTKHRQNMMGASWKQSGVGVAIKADGTCYMTQVFLLRK
jgi:uncharacterized protein YkwD